MTKQDIDPIKTQQQMEQYDAAVAGVATIAATYYAGLIKNGIPQDLAYQLVVDWHTAWWRTVMGLPKND